MERFDDWVERRLYDPDSGFYATAGSAGGARGDFLTSPEVGPLFGTVLARALDAWWAEAGQPHPFPVVDAGSGPGTLWRALLAAEPRCSAAWRPVSVERSAAQRARQADLVERGVEVRGDLPDLAGAVVVANELLDNLPFRVVERADAGWVEWWVDGDRPTSRPLAGDPPSLDVEPGTPVPVLEAAAAWVADVVGRGARRLVVVDYGAPTTVELVDRGGWLRTYAGHRRGSDPFAAPGHTDITVDVAVDQLPPPAAVATQAEFLRRWGIEGLVEEGREQWRREAARPTVASLRARSRIAEADALCDPDGLGAFLVCEWVG